MHAEQAEFAEFGGELTDRKLAVLVPRRDVRCDASFHQRAHRIPDLAFLVVEHAVDTQQDVRGGGAAVLGGLAGHDVS